MTRMLTTSLILAIIAGSPLAAQTAGRLNKQQLIQWAQNNNVCGDKLLIDVFYVDQTHVNVKCGPPAGAAAEGSLGTNTKWAIGAAALAVLGLAGSGSSGSSTTTTTTTTTD